MAEALGVTQQAVHKKHAKALAAAGADQAHLTTPTEAVLNRAV